MDAQTARHWHWLGAGVIPLISSLMRVAWLGPLLRFALESDVVTPQGVRFPTWLILVLLMGANVVGGLLRRTHARRGKRGVDPAGALTGLLAVACTVVFAFLWSAVPLSEWWAAVISWPASLAEGMPAALVIMVAAAGIWWRGLTASWQDYGQLFTGFVVGLAALAVLLLAAEPAAWALRGLNVWITVAGFILSALLSLALLATYEMLSWERFRGQSPGFSRHWVAVIAVIIVAILVLGWGAGRFVEAESAQRVAATLRPVKALARRGVELVLLASGYLAFEVFGGLMSVLKRVIGRLLGGLVSFLRLWVRESADAVGEAAARSGLGDRGVQVLAWALLILAIASILYVAIRRFRPVFVEGTFDRRDSVWSRPLLVAQIRSLFHRRRHPRAQTPLVPLGDAQDTRRAIRRLYRRLLTRMQDAGHARLPSLTPRAYELRIAEHIHAERAALHALTDAYLLARYSPDDPTPEQVLEADRALRRIEAELGLHAPDAA